MNIVLTPWAWEHRIKQGQLAGELMRPIHPLHQDVAYFAGWKVVVIVLWLPLAAILTLAFQPSLNPSWLEIGVFSVAIWGAYLIRTMLLWLLGMMAFWSTRVTALYELFFALELLLSGRLVPMALLPDWARQIANFLPFQWCFGFPIEALVGQLTPQQLFVGLGMQLLWIILGLGAVQIVWRMGIKQFASVGG
jgi:ABC-2 type transport system permease protein